MYSHSNSSAAPWARRRPLSVVLGPSCSQTQVPQAEAPSMAAGARAFLRLVVCSAAAANG
eukprot:8136055-Pyramimonas_sp.AAC.1